MAQGSPDRRRSAKKDVPWIGAFLQLKEGPSRDPVFITAISNFSAEAVQENSSLADVMMATDLIGLQK